MKKFLRILSVCIAFINAAYSNAQCGAGYTQATLNWDRVDYYWNSGGGAPYQSYVTDAMEMNQKFAIGPNYVTIALSTNDMVSPPTGSPTYGSAENATHTGDAGSYGTGDDVQFNTSTSATRTITFTFATEVQNLKFSLYDLDNNQMVTVTAQNAISVAQPITLSQPSGGAVTIVGIPVTAPTGMGTGNYGVTVNNATLNIDIAGPVKTVVLSFSNASGDFWLSDITACVFGSFPNNYNQTPDNRPLQGPAGNQPDYFIVTPDNNSAYMVDPATGNASLLFTDASKNYINSFAYDPYNHFLYYISENISVNSGNRELKRYNFNTGTSSSLITDITTTLGIPTMGSGIESAGAAFYDGALYLGIEGGRSGSNSSTVTRETIFWRIDLDASQNPTVAYQVFATDAYQNASNTSIHDFGDFIIKNGVLYSFNTARNGSNYSMSSYHQFNMTTGLMNTYINPGILPWNGQAGMTWNGDLYYFRNTTTGNSGVGYYNELGTNNAPINITVVDGSGAWPGGNGDASENFRPQVDFGDAPASYDPNPVSPAAHDRNANLRLGAGFDKEWVTRGQTALANSDNYDDGLAWVQIYNPDYGNYLGQASVYNNTGSNATLAAWLDYNGNGQFDASEGITVTVPSSASSQNVWLYWPSIPATLSKGAYTYLRVRITSASNGMTTSNATGYYNTGEVEDYRVTVDNFPLSVQLLNFNAQLKNATTAKLTWSLTDESDANYYSVEKSKNKNDWSVVELVSPKKKTGVVNYEVTDGNVSEGITYYRLKIVEKDSKVIVSTIKQIDNKANKFSILIAPNPVSTKAGVSINAPFAGKGVLELVNSLGVVVYKENISINAGTNSMELPVSNLANGTYIVTVTINSKSLRQSLIVNK